MQSLRYLTGIFSKRKLTLKSLQRLDGHVFDASQKLFSIPSMIAGHEKWLNLLVTMSPFSSPCFSSFLFLQLHPELWKLRRRNLKSTPTRHFWWAICSHVRHTWLALKMNRMKSSWALYMRFNYGMKLMCTLNHKLSLFWNRSSNSVITPVSIRLKVHLNKRKTNKRYEHVFQNME